MPSPRPVDTVPKMFTIRAIVTETGDVLSLSDTIKMRLPFDEGWELWAVYQMGEETPIYTSTNFSDAEKIWASLIFPIL
jgi:hypothetical protein